ncbi:MAG: BREX-1 system phosphatase PglZ type A, partial [Caldisericia bacterium]|nr:BREX-1 system phosphatase PglZ type A [Caldisericia bacterium]
LQNLFKQMQNETLSVSKLKETLEARRSSVWYSTFEPNYKALEAAGELFELLHSLNFKCSSFENGIENYSNSWYKLDMYYRLYQFHVKNIIEDDFSELTKKVENFYINRYVIPVNESWQKQIDVVEKWKGSLQYPLQNDFYSSFVEAEFSSVRNLKHLVVIVSDALRYEVGWELYNKATMLDKVKASISPMISMLPSYTQLGMASLLPGKSLEIDSKGNVLRDNKSTSGKDNRKNILETVDGSAIKADEFLGFNSKERKEFLSKYRVVYIYQNKIDSIGHKKDSELQAFEACNDTVEQLLTMVRKIITANRYNIIVTADHGFLYQKKELDGADFNTETPSEPNTIYKDRRFIIAPSISKSSSINVFTSSQLGLQGNYEAAFPKSITRFRLQGSCSLFVHGGTSLQEVVLPVVKINYNTKREGASDVEYKLDASTSSIISTSVLALSFSQTEAISSAIRQVQIRVELVTENGDVISDSHDIILDSTSEKFSERRKKVSLTLSSDADKHNNQEVFVVVSKNVPNTSQYVIEYRVPYTLKRTFTIDF